MAVLDPRAFLDAIFQLFQRRGWRDRDNAADAILIAAASAPDRALESESAASAVPSAFLERNGISKSQLARALDDEMAGAVVGSDRESFELLPIDEVDSFAIVREVEADQVRDFAAPIQINERVIKHCIHRLVGDPYIDEDWGGERSDIGTGRVFLGGSRKLTGFLLKGRSVQGPLYGSELGTRGDQIVRLLEVRAELSVVQHVHQIPTETQDQLRYGVIALRVTGVPAALGSAWDGVDTARLLLAAGYIDERGALTEAGLKADEELKNRKKSG